MGRSQPCSTSIGKGWLRIGTVAGNPIAKHALSFDMSSKRVKYDRVAAQTAREWGYEYETGKPVWPLAWGAVVGEGYLITPHDFDPGYKDALKPRMKMRVTIRI